MPFNVGDIVTTGSYNYTVTELVGLGRVCVRDSDGDLVGGDHSNHIFTLVTPSKTKLTGMTQFFKDKEKSNVT
jgi:hypothetical protein